MDKLTSLDKIKLLVGKDNWSSNDLNNYFTSFKVSDASIGLRKVYVDNYLNIEKAYPAISYPSLSVLSQTFNKNLAYKLGEAIASDCKENDIDIILGPGINIKRNPLCGRNFEYLSEDPYLAGILAREYIKAVEENHIGTCLKHYLANNSEYSRLWNSSEVDERTLREIYLKPFEISLEVNPLSLMTSYNLVNGVKMCENKPLIDLLRKEFNYKGLIFSDWDAVFDATKSINAGLNLIMPYRDKHIKNLEESFKNKTLDLNKVEESFNIFKEVNKKILENRKYKNITLSTSKKEEISLKIAENGAVLLKNNGVLPLNKNLKILVSGAPIKHYFNGGGSSEVTLRNEFISLDEALNKLGIETIFSESWWENPNGTSSMTDIRTTMNLALNKDVTILGLGNYKAVECEGHDRESIALSKMQLEAFRLLRKVSKKLIVIIYAGSVVDLKEISEGSDALIYAGFGGEFVNVALSNILVGIKNPCGRLSETFPLNENDINTIKNFRNESLTRYEEGLNVGYRYYLTKNIDVLYPFGYGLSYGEVSYSDFDINFKNNELKVKFNLTNLSNFETNEVIQIYIEPINSYAYRPLRELKEFDSINLKENETKQLEFNLPLERFSSFSVNEHKFKINNGFYKILVNKNAKDVIFEKIVEIKL